MGQTDLPAQYDVTPREKRMIEDRAKLRAELRKEYVKQITNPHRHGHGGYLFDPALQRWQSMKAQQYYYFKPNPKTFWVPALVVLCCAGYGYLFHIRRESREVQYRRGEVAYADRQFKFV